MNKFSTLFCFFSLTLLTACSTATVEVDPITAIPIPREDVRDFSLFPQNLNYYADKLPKGLLIAQSELDEKYTRFQKLFFNAWKITKSTQSLKDVQAPLLIKNKGYAENLLPWDIERWQKIVTNADMRTFPNTSQYAITVKQTSVREIPTKSPRFSHPSKAGQGYPFDLLQYSTFSLGFPLYVVHVSEDKAWAYVETALVSGWVDASDIAYVDSTFRQKWESAKLAAITSDNVPLTYNNAFLTYASIGTLLPIAPSSQSFQGSMQVLVPVRNMAGVAQSVACSVSAQDAQAAPMPFTANAVALLGNRMIGQPYGWGGYLNNRDCSAMLRDLYAGFGIWLPRNSKAQAVVGSDFDISKLSPKEKERTILSEAQPFLSFIYLPGHIGLYIGEVQGRVAYLNNLWGVRTVNDGRYIIGRVAVTSLEPGIERADVEKEKAMLSRVTRFNIL